MDNEFKKRFINESENTRSLIIVIGYLREYRKAIGYSDNVTLPQLLHYHILIFYITTYKIYGIGRQESGEFGYGKHTTNKDAYIRLDRYEKHLVASSLNIHRGKERLSILSDNRKLYEAGFNERGECGVDSWRYKITNLSLCPLKRDTFINLVSDGAWNNHTILRVNDGSFYGFGINHHGEFGDDYKSYDMENKPRKLSKLTTFFKNTCILKIATGMEHTLFLTLEGYVYSVGNNEWGQLGIEQDAENTSTRYKYKLTPQRVILAMPKKKRRRSTLNVNLNFDEGKEEEEEKEIETEIKEDDGIVNGELVADICCGEDYNLCLTQQNELFVFGNNINGQLGMGLNDKLFYRTPMLHTTFNANNHENDEYGVVCMMECGKAHSCLVNDKGIGFLFGYNGYGQIGNGHVNEWKDGIKIPNCFQRMHDNYKNLKIKQVSLSMDHTVILTEGDNRIITFGGNEHNQCSPNNVNDKILFPHFLHYDEIGLTKPEIYERVIAATRSTVIIIAEDSGKVHDRF